MKKHIIATIAVLLVSGQLSAQAPLTAVWALDETTGTTAADGSLNANHGTLVNFVGNPWVAGALGNALMLDGLDDYVTCMTNGGLPVHGTGGYAVTGWVNAPPQNDRRIYSEGSSVTNIPLVTIGSGTSLPSSLRVYIRNDSNVALVATQTTTPVFDSTWHHFAWVDDGAGGARVYVDGVLDATSFAYTAIGTYTTDLVALGAVLRAIPSHWLTGILDDVRVYPFPITQSDVAAIINNATLGTGFQANQAGAALDVNGFSSSVASAGRVTVAQGAALTLNLSTNAGGFPWELASGATLAVPNGLVLDPTNILNIPLGSLALANGFFATPWGTPLSVPGFPATGYSLSTSLTYTAPMSTLFLAVQFAMVDPAAPSGISFSGVTEIDVP